MQSSKKPENKAKGTGEWENEGGSVKPAPSATLPDGVTAVTVTHYRVGRYTYTSLNDALAEHRRQSGS